MDYPFDLQQFWQNDALSHLENCFSATAPQVALGIVMSDECVFAELDVPMNGSPWAPLPADVRRNYNRRYNDVAEKTVGKRLLNENIPPDDAKFPQYKRIGEVFGGQYTWTTAGGEWLSSPITDAACLEKQLDWIDRADLRAFMLPANWQSEKKRIYEKYGLTSPRFHYLRGPVTLACSLMGVENFIYLLSDAPELCDRFSSTICRVAIEMTEILDEEAGSKQRGFYFYDDDCCLLSPRMYKRFGYPVLQDIFAHFCPDNGDMRYQHSDSSMAHLLPILGNLNFSAVNFGPDVMIDQIRQHMPNTRIDGAIAPYTFMNNDAEAILAEVKRDCILAKQHGHGVNLGTAGSVNNGSLLKSLRVVMHGIEQYGQY